MATAMTPKNGHQQPPASTRTHDRVVDAVIKLGTFATLLPAPYRPMADRMLARARFYIARDSKLHDCTIESLCQCVLQAGENGHCLDGKMAYAVPFNCKKKDSQGREYWAKEATYMPSYIGIVDICRRHGCIKDAYARNVYQNDVFRYGMKNGEWYIEHIPSLVEKGDYVGTYAVVERNDGRIIMDFMNDAEINAIRSRSKAKDNGPWVTDLGEMRKKTVVKRAVKTYVSDPEAALLIEHDNEHFGYIESESDSTPSSSALPAVKSLDQLADRLDALPAPVEVEPMDFASEPIEAEVKRPAKPAAKKQQAEPLPGDDDLAAEAYAREQAESSGELFGKGKGGANYD